MHNESMTNFISETSANVCDGDVKTFAIIDADGDGKPDFLIIRLSWIVAFIGTAYAFCGQL